MVRMFCLEEPILQHRMDLNSCQTSNMLPSSLLSKTMKLLVPDSFFSRPGSLPRWLPCRDRSSSFEFVYLAVYFLVIVGDSISSTFYKSYLLLNLVGFVWWNMAFISCEIYTGFSSELHTTKAYVLLLCGTFQLCGFVTLGSYMWGTLVLRLPHWPWMILWNNRLGLSRLQVFGRPFLT